MVCRDCHNKVHDFDRAGFKGMLKKQLGRLQSTVYKLMDKV